jgi:hypothetical protein
MSTDQKSQTEHLMNELLEVAERLLLEHGEFHPFAGYLLTDGTVTQVGLDMHEELRRSDKERVRQLERALRSVANTMSPTAIGLVTNVSVPSADGVIYDAIEIDLEHRAGYCAEVFFGYELHVAPDRALSFTATTAQAGPAGRFFGSR